MDAHVVAPPGGHQVEAGKLEIHPELFALRTLVEDLRTVFEPLAADKQLRFAVVTGGDVPAFSGRMGKVPVDIEVA